MSQNIARVAVAAATFAIDRPYDYTIPECMIEYAVPGMRVLVPFGQGNKNSEGVILSLADESNSKRLKSITALLDDVPALCDENLRLALWMSDRFFCTVFDALKAMLPAGMWFKDGVMKQSGKTIKIATLSINPNEADVLADEKRLRSPKQADVLSLLAGVGSMPIKDIYSITGAASPVMNALIKQNLLSVSEHKIYRRPEIKTIKDPKPITLTQGQQSVFDAVAPLVESENPEAVLLHGVTGSGKTLIYLKLIEHALALGKTAVVLVPEIALTPQTVSIFASYFGDMVAVLHSALGTGERFDEWKRIRSGVVRVVVGTRSAIFAPLKDIGLIVIDEEQEHTYKSESSPRYHARDVAKYRITHSGGLLLLSSATPSIESMHHAKTGKYKLFRIESRYNNKSLPEVLIADMRKELKDGNGGSISSVLRREIEYNLQNNEQTILFINRRGTNPLVACGECGFTFRCEKCTVNMTYHDTNKRLLCHYCGFSHPIHFNCPDCKGRLKYVGAGTQKVEVELEALFPGVGTIRMDADTVSRLNSHDKLLSSFREGNAQILLGTQMVTKGLDFENVTLVGVVSADASLYMSDYRAHERAFSLITQVVGRSGRGDKPGRAVIQTLTPAHDVIKLASKQDYDEFYAREIVFRQAQGSPPIHDLMTITATGSDETAVLQVCAKVAGALAYYFVGMNVKLLGPTPALVSKINNRYRYRLLVSCKNTKRVRNIIAHTLREISRDRLCRSVTVFADMDVYE
ncbi:MAG: primosomal protein N' [Oscillospiraceae bacterium]|nr:primosomal protein N' [Oscillospiraceae bacterium]